MAQRISEKEEQINAALEAVRRLARRGGLPDELKSLEELYGGSGLRPRVTLRHAAGRKMRRDASADAWEPTRGVIEIAFEPRQRGDDARAANESDDALSTLIRVMERAERDPRLRFIALKFLRDKLLPEADAPWTADPEACRRVVNRAIEQGLLHTFKEPNPRSPDYPTTAVRLDRSHSDVERVLGREALSLDGFAPASIEGGALSQTILDERG